MIRPELKARAESLAVTLRLIPTVAPGVFAPAKLAPGRNNLRAAQPASDGAAEQPLPATPLYNNAILQVAHSCCLGNLLHGSE